MLRPYKRLMNYSQFSRSFYGSCIDFTEKFVKTFLCRRFNLEGFRLLEIFLLYATGS